MSLLTGAKLEYVFENLLERKRVRERESQADFPLSVEPDMGLDFMTLRS